jgi:hypothetical protein
MFSRQAIVLTTLLVSAQEAMPADNSAVPLAEKFLCSRLWALTTQSHEITISDLSKALRFDLHNYKVEGSANYSHLTALDAVKPSKAAQKIESIVIMSASSNGGTQEVRIRLRADECVSKKVALLVADGPLMTEYRPCSDAAPCSSRMEYLAAFPTVSTGGEAKVSKLYVSDECSRYVTIAKVF